MTISRSEIVAEFVMANSDVAKLFTVTDAADVAERLLARAMEADRNPNRPAWEDISRQAIEQTRHLVHEYGAAGVRNIITQLIERGEA